MIEHREEDLQETWYSTVLSNGLNVVLFCKPLFVTSCAILAARLIIFWKMTRATGSPFPTGPPTFLNTKCLKAAAATQ